MRVLGVNAVFHDPAAALVVDGEIVAAAEEERFSRRKHGKSSVPFSTWELPVEAARSCPERAGLSPRDLDAVTYSYDPDLVHVDGTSRIQIVDYTEEPLCARMSRAFERRAGVPVVVSTSLNTAGRPMVDDARDALELFGSAPVDALAIGPFVVRRRRR